MKLANLLTVLLLIFIASATSAQSLKDFKSEIKQISNATEMNDNQIAQLREIYQKRVDNLASIAVLESTDEIMYRNKRRAIYESADVSIKLMLNREQLSSYKLYRQGIRKIRARKIEKLKKKNASQQDLLDAQYGVI